MFRAIVISLFLLPFAAVGAQSLEEAVESPLRTAANVDRDVYRHPLETLQFFGVREDSRVLEIWPGRGWYTEILAPYLADKGDFIAAHFPSDSEIGYFQRSRAAFEARISEEPDLFRGTELVTFFPPAHPSPVAADSVDFVLTFRNVHNWMKGGYAEQAFQQFAEALKPGGILGVVEHRARPGTSLEDMIASGYVTEKKVIELAKAAGLALVESSEINANAKDTTIHDNGVWTLPPTLRAGEDKKAYYALIGESDRMTLKFTKPR